MLIIEQRHYSIFDLGKEERYVTAEKSSAIFSLMKEFRRRSPYMVVRVWLIFLLLLCSSSNVETEFETENGCDEGDSAFGHGNSSRETRRSDDSLPHIK